MITDNIVMWDGSALSTGEDSKSTSGWVLCIFRSLQEANISIPQFYTI